MKNKKVFLAISIFKSPMRVRVAWLEGGRGA